MSSTVLVIVAIYGVVCGVFCTVVANSKGRDGGAWFWLGLLFGMFALIALAAMPVLASPELQPVRSNADSAGEPDSLLPSDAPVADLASDGYRLWLAEAYNIKRNEVFDQFVVDQQLFPTLDAALVYADGRERQARQHAADAAQRASEVAEFEAQQREIKERELAERRKIEEAEAEKGFRTAILGALLIVACSVGLVVYLSAMQNDQEAAAKAQEQAALSDQTKTALAAYGLSLSPAATAVAVAKQSNNCTFENFNGSTLVTLRTKDTADQITAYYAKEASAAGYRPRESGRYSNKDGRNIYLTIPTDKPEFTICLEGDNNEPA